jgi:phospholipid/cholesterol/gamma-HCH transport system substrate-binding protein
MVLLSQTSTNLNTAATSLQTVLGRIEAGEGTLGRLSTSDSLYVNMNAAASSLNALLEDLRANPNRYINISIF